MKMKDIQRIVINFQFVKLCDGVEEEKKRNKEERTVVVEGKRQGQVLMVARNQ